MERAFDRFAAWLGVQMGRPHMFSVVVALSVVWLAHSLLSRDDGLNNWLGAATGILSIILLVLLQNSTNRESAALHAKIDELIRVTDARNELIAAETLPAEDVAKLRAAVPAKARTTLEEDTPA